MNYVHPTYVLIQRLLEKKGPLSVKQVSIEMQMTFSGIKTAIRKMMALGLIDRIEFSGKPPAKGGSAPHTYVPKK